MRNWPVHDPTVSVTSGQGRGKDHFQPPFSTLPRSALTLWAALTRAGGGSVQLSHPELARMTGLAERSVRYAVDHLRRAGVLITLRPAGRPTTYILLQPYPLTAPTATALPAAAARVLAILASQAVHQAVRIPQAQLANLAGMSTRHVRRAIRELEQRGLVTVVATAGHLPTYVLSPVASACPHPHQSPEPVVAPVASPTWQEPPAAPRTTFATPATPAQRGKDQAPPASRPSSRDVAPRTILAGLPRTPSRDHAYILSRGAPPGFTIPDRLFHTAWRLARRYHELHPDPAVIAGTPDGVQAWQRTVHAMLKGLLEQIDPATLRAATEASAPDDGPWQVLAAARARHRRAKHAAAATRGTDHGAGMEGVPNADAYRPVDPARIRAIKAFYETPGAGTRSPGRLTSAA